MKSDQEFDRMFRQEFCDIVNNLIWQNDAGEYEVFGKYRIVPMRPGYQVFCSATDAGTFHSTRTALSWCIADKHSSYNLARELLETDNKLYSLNQDISARTAVGERSKDPNFRDIIATKLESKIINKKRLENQLTKCVNWAKYCQQRGFENETARTGRTKSNKTSR
jgi:sulfur transfer complex TusBCD TusB component (DsrH family)